MLARVFEVASKTKTEKNNPLKQGLQIHHQESDSDRCFRSIERAKVNHQEQVIRQVVYWQEVIDLLTDDYEKVYE